MPNTFELDAGIIAIDTEVAGMTELGATYLVPGERPAIIETGPATVATMVADGIEQIGVPREEVAYLVVSHIHLDHAGGAGDLIDVFPNATVVCHTDGARHLNDPTKLMASAYRVFGPALDTLFGPLKPVPQERLRAVDGGDRIDLGGGRHLEIIEGTGHARHHMGILDSQSGAIFVGDSMGVYVPEADILRPATPPPDFDLDLALATLERYRERRPSALYLTHFGPAPADRDMLAEAEERLRRYGEIIKDAMNESNDLDFLADRLRERTADDYTMLADRPDLQAKFEALNAWKSSAAGYLRYFSRHH
ncbi:MAG TPA: MBL fold metallo-hydrolase [Actinomycetota bacterium]|nr:MBL fold metallo-hydrolase [Actinomycetota bacterium]